MGNDKIFKYSEFLNENMHEAPEQYVENALTKLKNRIEKMFKYDVVDNGEVKKFGDVKDKDKKEKGEMSFKDLGLVLQSLEYSKYSKVYDNVKLIFSDNDSRYDAIFTIDLKDAVPTDEEKDFSDNDIKNCYIKFKKYDLEQGSKMVGQISKTAKIDDIDEEFLIDLKIELDDEYGSDDEQFELELE